MYVANRSPAGLAASLASPLPGESGYTGILVAGYLRAVAVTTSQQDDNNVRTLYRTRDFVIDGRNLSCSDPSQRLLGCNTAYGSNIDILKFNTMTTLCGYEHMYHPTIMIFRRSLVQTNCGISNDFQIPNIFVYSDVQDCFKS